MAIAQEQPHAKVGVSVGTCFVGMCGSPKRHDFVVMGVEVNVAARLMVNAAPGEVLVSADVESATRELISYEKVSVAMNKKTQEHQDAFRPEREIARRPSFLAQYRYGQRDKDLFVGRVKELAQIESTVNSLCFGHTAGPQIKGKQAYVPKSGIIVIEVGLFSLYNSSQFLRRSLMPICVAKAPAGMGKSALVTRVRKLGKGRIKVATTAAFSLDQDHDFYVFSHLLEAYTGLRYGQTTAQIKHTLEDYGGDESLDPKVLGEVCFINAFFCLVCAIPTNFFWNKKTTKKTRSCHLCVEKSQTFLSGRELPGEALGQRRLLIV